MVQQSFEYPGQLRRRIQIEGWRHPCLCAVRIPLSIVMFIMRVCLLRFSYIVMLQLSVLRRQHGKNRNFCESTSLFSCDKCSLKQSSFFHALPQRRRNHRPLSVTSFFYPLWTMRFAGNLPSAFRGTAWRGHHALGANGVGTGARKSLSVPSIDLEGMLTGGDSLSSVQS